MISFVIRTKDEEELLGVVLQNLLKQDFPKGIELIVVDSGSEDETLNIASEYGAKIIHIAPEDFSWGGALNLGIESASGNIIGIISGHCIPDSNDLCKVVDSIFQSDLSLSGVYGQQVPITYYDPFEEIELEEWYPSNLEKKFSTMEDSVGISNACSFIRKDVWSKLKFDDKLQSAEDADWAKKLIDKGYLLAYSSKIRVQHSHKLSPFYLYKKWYWRTLEGWAVTASSSSFRRYMFGIKQILISPNEFYQGFKFVRLRYKEVTFIEYSSFFLIKKVAVLFAIFGVKNKSYKNTTLPKVLLSSKKNLEQLEKKLVTKRKIF